MKNLILVFTPILVTTASAWSLYIQNYEGGMNLITTWVAQVPCSNFTFSPLRSVDTVNFRSATPEVGDVNGFEVFGEADCKGKSFRGGNGDHKLEDAMDVSGHRVF